MGCMLMKSNQIKLWLFQITIVSLFTFTSYLYAGEKVIQKEKISFEKCLNIISVSADKLSTYPKISDDSDRKRVAVFVLSDGTLKITCDKENELVIVSTALN